jgi:hypothetical protein
VGFGPLAAPAARAPQEGLVWNPNVDRRSQADATFNKILSNEQLQRAKEFCVVTY